MMRPTLRAVLCFSLSVPLALLIVSVWGRYWYFSLYFPSMVLAFMAADIARALPDRALHAELYPPELLYVGHSADVTLKLSSDDYGRQLMFQALLEQTGPADAPLSVLGMMQGGRLELRLGITARRRGKLTIDALWLRWRAPLGLIEIRRRQPIGASINIVLNIRNVKESALQFLDDNTEYGVKSQSLRGEGSEFEDICEYQQGMDYRLIDWKRSARHRKILCKQFRQERNHHIVLGFDTGRLMLEQVDDISKLDHAVLAGLMLGWVSLRNGDLLGGCGFDARFRSFFKPDKGMQHFARFQRFTSELAYRTDETNFTLALAELNSRLKTRSLVILFTEFVDMISAELLIESLQWMTRRHVIIFVTMSDPVLMRLRDAPPRNFGLLAEAVIADDFLRERAIVLERISRLGIHCLDVPARGISTALINRYLLIKRRGLI
ncbi:MAG: DUF58 domain-containing protein [Synergistaceae bacterium]|jgi:uncharacterized protein (DUF58 family)|nr:DUF58 domain-containing protein [Synergistaceae bacterium]